MREKKGECKLMKTKKQKKENKGKNEKKEENPRRRKRKKMTKCRHKKTRDANGVTRCLWCLLW